jgi:hypothetical protein
MKLTEKAELDRIEWEDMNCTCHLHPPCAKCIHPGNPEAQENNPEWWEEESNDT